MASASDVQSQGVAVDGPSTASHGRIGSIAVNRIGLSEVYSPPEGTNVAAQYCFTALCKHDPQLTPASIVFIHGLFGHPHDTWYVKQPKAKDRLKFPGWKKNTPGATHHDAIESAGKVGVFWPQDLLPHRTPEAKIFTFGYDADIDSFWSSAGQNTITQHAQSLLSDLTDLRRTSKAQAVPIIFVAHSLGGIIVKDALNQSASTWENRQKDIVPSVFAVCFLGTPHRGSSTATTARRAYNLTTIVSKRPNLRILRSLEKNAETLDRIGNNFVQTMSQYDIKIYSFHEEQEIRRYLFLNTIVVEPDSAKIGGVKEGLNSIPANHRNMTKFGSAEDVGFTRVSAQLKVWVEEIGAHHMEQEQSDVMISLNDNMTRARIADVNEAHERTYRWLFDPTVVSFPEWLGTRGPTASPIYWIQGKPGSGKSTLMKLGMSDARTKELLISDGAEGWIIAAFFFHDRGSEIQKSIQGMLQELLRSILAQIPALMPFMIAFYRELAGSQMTKAPRWDSKSLGNALSALIEQREVPARIMIFLDGLDEHSGNNVTLASALKNLADKSIQSSVALKMCVAGRPWTVFEAQFGHYPGLAIHEHTRQDIQTFTTSRLELSFDTIPPSMDQSSMSRLMDLVADKAMGVFIWVRLIIDLLIKGVRDGTPYLALERQITQVPQELFALYTDTVRRIEPEYRTEAFILLEMVLRSLVPLPIESLMACLDINYNTLLGYSLPANEMDLPETSKLDDAVQYANQNMGQPVAALSHRLTSRSGGLLEMIPRPTRNRFGGSACLGYDVQFIHQTVKDFVLKCYKTLEKSSVPQKVLAEDGNWFLLRSCASTDAWVACIKNSVFRYANRCIHAGASGPSVAKMWRGVMLRRGSVDMKWVCTIALSHYIAETIAPSSMSLATLSTPSGDRQAEEKVLAMFTVAVGMYLSTIINPHSMRQEQTALSRPYEAFRISLRLMYGLDVPLLIHEYLKGHPTYIESMNMFGNEVKAGEPARCVFHIFMTNPPSYPELLHVAVSRLWCDTDVTIDDRIKVVKLLISRGYPIDHLDNWRYRVPRPGSTIELVEHKMLTPLGWVLAGSEPVTRNRLKIASTLLQLGANPNTHVYIVKLNRNAPASPQNDTDVDVFPNKLSLLQYCVCYETDVFVRLLLKYKADINIESQGWSLLSLAIVRRAPDIIETLRQHGLELRDKGETPHDPYSIREAMMIPIHVAAAQTGGWPATLFSVDQAQEGG